MKAYTPTRREPRRSRRRPDESTRIVADIRLLSEALLLLLVVASPWPFGSIHPGFRYYLTAGISAILLLWAAELLIDPKAGFWSRFQTPLVVLVAICVLQLVPLGPLLDVVSPSRAALDTELYPTTNELLANGQTADMPLFSARGKLSLYPAETFRRCLWITLLALLFTRVQSLATTDTLRRLCWACLINGGLLGFLAIAQKFTSDYHTLFWTYEAGASVFGPFINRNHFAFYMNMCCGLAVGLLGARISAEPVVGDWRERILTLLRDSTSLWIISLLCFMCGSLFLCSSRGGMGSLILAFLLVAMAMGFGGQVGQAARWFMIGSIVLGLALGIQAWLGFDLGQSRLTSARDNRTALWMPLLQLVSEFPVFGSGYGTLGYLEPMTRSGSTAEYFLEYAHNEYLQLAVETGLGGLACGCVLLGMLVARNLRLIRAAEKTKFLMAGLMLCLCAVAIHSFVEFGLVIPSIGLLAVVICGHIAGIRRRPVRKKKKLPHLVTRFAGLAIIVITVAVFQQAKSGDLAHRAWLGSLRARNAAAALQPRVDELRAQVASGTATDTAVLDLQQLEELQAEEEQKRWALTNEAARHRPSDAELRLEVVRLGYASLGDTESELVFLQTNLSMARELCPLTADAHLTFGLEAAGFQRSETPITHFLRARKTRPTDATLAYIAGIECLKANEIEAGIAQLRDSLSLADDHLAETLEMAVESFDDETIENDLIPKQAAVMVACANWLETNANRGELVTQLRRQALSLPILASADSGHAYHLKATQLDRLGDAEGAIEAYRNALRFEPGNIDWRIERVTLLKETGDLEEAIKEVNRIRRQASNDRRVQLLMNELVNLKLDSAAQKSN